MSTIDRAFFVNTVQQEHFFNLYLNDKTLAVVSQFCQGGKPVDHLINQYLILLRILDKFSLTIDC